MGFHTSLIGGLLYLSAATLADPTWPSSIDELEELMYQVEGARNRQFGGTVMPCSSEASGPGRQNAAEWLRTGFHNIATASNGRGGMDGSLQFETNRLENTGPGFATTLEFMSNYYTTRSGVADLIALGVYYSVRSCGGPSIPVRGGRIDATEDGAYGVPQPQNSIQSFQDRFAAIGFSPEEMIQLTACGHTLGGVHEEQFPDIAPAASDGGEAGLDSTVAAFDNKVVTEYLDGTTKNPLVVGQSVQNGRNSDGRIFGSDGNVTVSAMRDPNTFQNTCKAVLQKMIEIVPSGVKLTDPIQPYFVKPVAMQLTLTEDPTIMTMSGFIRVRTTSMGNNFPTSVTVTYKNRNGGSDCGTEGCSFSAGLEGQASGFDDSFAWFPLAADVQVSSGISAFTVTLNMADGTSKLVDNNGAWYPMNDGILIQKPQSCLLNSPTSGQLSVTAAVRNDRNYLPVSLVVHQKTLTDGIPVAKIEQITLPMSRGSCVGAYTFYTAAYTVPGSLSDAVKVDVVSGTGPGAIGDYFHSGTELGGTCSSFSMPSADSCTTASAALIPPSTTARIGTSSAAPIRNTTISASGRSAASSTTSNSSSTPTVATATTASSSSAVPGRNATGSAKPTAATATSSSGLHSGGISGAGNDVATSARSKTINSTRIDADTSSTATTSSSSAAISRGTTSSSVTTSSRTVTSSSAATVLKTATSSKTTTSSQTTTSSRAATSSTASLRAVTSSKAAVNSAVATSSSATTGNNTSLFKSSSSITSSVISIINPTAASDSIGTSTRSSRLNITDSTVTDTVIATRSALAGDSISASKNVTLTKSTAFIRDNTATGSVVAETAVTTSTDRSIGGIGNMTSTRA